MASWPASNCDWRSRPSSDFSSAADSRSRWSCRRCSSSQFQKLKARASVGECRCAATCRSRRRAAVRFTYRSFHAPQPRCRLLFIIRRAICRRIISALCCVSRAAWLCFWVSNTWRTCAASSLASSRSARIAISASSASFCTRLSAALSAASASFCTRAISAAQLIGCSGASASDSGARGSAPGNGARVAA